MRAAVLLGRVVWAGLGGAGVYLSYQPHGHWYLGIIGVAMLISALMPIAGTGLRWFEGALVGLAHGLAHYLLMLPWIGVYVGSMPYVALAVTESLYTMVLGVFLGWALRERWGLVCAPFLVVGAEWVRSSWPFGGFAWGRIAWGQVGGPLAELARIAGPTLVTFATAVAAVGLLLLLTRRLWWGLAVTGATACAVLATVALPTAAPVGEITVAAVQGNVPRMGLDFNAQRREVLRNHVRETEKIPRPADIVIWPENASDVNPFADASARLLIDHAARSAAAPILVGTITRDEVGPRNTMVVMNPDGTAGEYHHKKFLQPFGEYMPLRDFFRRFSPLVDQAGNFQPGTGTGVVHMTAARSGTPVAVGVSTCYEVAFDASARSAVAHGAQILTTPTNNATFGFTDMTYQQLAMSRLRAIETDRAVVVAATSGVSALISPEGDVLAETTIFTPAVLEDTLPLKDSLTIASRYGSAIAAGLDIMGGLCAAAALVGAWRDTRRTRRARTRRPVHT